jgi:acyl-CoA reductase-like NAD-dependent aldehyde dehydrogenase
MKMLIDSTWSESSDGMWFEVCDPATGELLDQVPAATLNDAQHAVAAGQHGAAAMRRLPAYDRAAILHVVADKIDANLPQLADLLVRENGKPISQIRVNWGSALRVETLGFGGIKLSGHGRESVHDTLTAMTYEKSIVVHNALSQFEPRQ